MIRVHVKAKFEVMVSLMVASTYTPGSARCGSTRLPCTCAHESKCVLHGDDDVTTLPSDSHRGCVAAGTWRSVSAWQFGRFPTTPDGKLALLVLQDAHHAECVLSHVVYALQEAANLSTANR